MIDSAVSNTEIIRDGAGKSAIKIIFPKESYDPKSAITSNSPYPGVNVKVPFDQGYECVVLTYDLKFSEGFNFVKGGKLPGLYGGAGNTGGKIPNGYDGFSTRFMWLPKGGGAVYAYLPSSENWGTAIGSTSWSFRNKDRIELKQLVRLNSIGHDDGVIKVWLDGKLVFYTSDLVFRYGEDLLVDGVLFSSFFGGNRPEFGAKER